MNAARRIRPAALAGALCAGLLLLAAGKARGQEDVFDRIDNQLSFGGWKDSVRVRVSGTLDLEGYSLSQPAPGLFYTESDSFLVPRLSLFLDAQLGPHVYAFVQARADNGFDPGESGARVRLDEYVVRFTPWDNSVVNLQAGKFATMVGNWSPRHGSWDNPFITAPLPYENLTGIWDTNAVRSTEELQAWAGILAKPTKGGALLDMYRNVPVIWGPSYGSGAAVFGNLGMFDYAVEVKNTSLSGRPQTWSPTATQWQQPTVSGRVGFQPDVEWNFGVSASEGPYLRSDAGASLPVGRSLDQYEEVVLGQDVSYAWHHVQVWAEAYEAEFRIPGVGNADTQAYYVEAKYKLTPQLFAAVRWNEQFFSRLTNAAGQQVPWSRDVWRIDVGPGYRFTPHTQVKIQYSLEHQAADRDNWGSLVALQFTTRF